MSVLGDELVRHCWHLLHDGQPHRALLLAERAMRVYQPPADSILSGRLSLIVGVALAALGRAHPARRYLEDASWSLAHAFDRDDGIPGPDPPGPSAADVGIEEPLRAS